MADGPWRAGPDNGANPRPGTIHWEGGSQEAAFKMAMETAAMEGPQPAICQPTPLPGGDREERVYMADTDVSVGIEVRRRRRSSRCALSLTLRCRRSLAIEKNARR